VLTRLQLMQAHALVAAFIILAAVMFMTTGAFYAWGVKGTHINEVYEVQLKEPMQHDLSKLTALAEL